jgi:hypothetical protein
VEFVGALDDLRVWDVDGGRDRAALQITREPAIDERPAGGDVLDDLELAEGGDARSEHERLDDPPGRIDDKQPGVTVDRARHSDRVRAASEPLGPSGGRG